MFKKTISLLLLLLTSSLLLNAQTANVRGFIYAKDNGEAALFTNIYLKSTTYGNATDVNGFFNITKIKPGTYTLVATYLGYDTIFETITLAADQIVTKKLYLNKSTIQLTEVIATGEQQAKKENTQVSVNRIDPVEIKKLPSVGQPDLAQYLQVLPGVTFTGDQGGQLYIRGGSPVQNKVLLDGMIIYNPFHSIGLFSVFDNDIIKNADVYTAG
ncbi:MAG TPA: TonB-dependent receptor, partial [Bacteroidia bacterium]|nr:TonB-dependent receptor [Bacteroidia bacterium]